MKPKYFREASKSSSQGRTAGGTAQFDNCSAIASASNNLMKLIYAYVFGTRKTANLAALGMGPLALLSLLYVVYLIVTALTTGIDSPGYITLITAILGVGGLQLLFLGVIGEYVGRIYYEVKHRPPFIVADAGGVALPTSRPAPALPPARTEPAADAGEPA